MITRFRDNFITGIIVILPVAITLWLLVAAYNAVTEGVLNPLIKYFAPTLTNIYLEYAARTVVLLVLIVLTVLIGFATRIIFIRKVFSAGERIFFKMPMIGKVYVTMKQMSKAFLGERRGIFKAPVLVEYPRKGIYAIGFLTAAAKGEIQQKTNKKLVNIFIPTTPNPTSGILLLTPGEEIINLSMSVEEAMKLIISGGVVTPEELLKDTG
jgi:uncharacterized membrane protein